MPLIYNGTNVSRILYNGTDLDYVDYNGTRVFEKPTVLSTSYTPQSNDSNIEIYLSCAYPGRVGSVTGNVEVYLSDGTRVGTFNSSSSDYSSWKPNIKLKNLTAGVENNVSIYLYGGAIDKPSFFVSFTRGGGANATRPVGTLEQSGTCSVTNPG